MIDYVHRHFAKHRSDSHTHNVVPVLVCADGTSLSVQASSSHYCSPRSDTGPWPSVEVWCLRSPNGRAINARSFGTDNAGGPYGWVPVDTVNKFIHRHGGLKEG